MFTRESPKEHKSTGDVTIGNALCLASSEPSALFIVSVHTLAGKTGAFPIIASRSRHSRNSRQTTPSLPVRRRFHRRESKTTRNNRTGSSRLPEPNLRFPQSNAISCESRDGHLIDTALFVQRTIPILSSSQANDTYGLLDLFEVLNFLTRVIELHACKNAQPTEWRAVDIFIHFIRHPFQLHDVFLLCFNLPSALW